MTNSMVMDYLDAIETESNNPFTTDLVTLTKSERSIISQLLSDLANGGNCCTTYGNGSLFDLQYDANSIIESLSRGKRQKDYLFFSKTEWGNPGFDYVDNWRMKLSGTAFKLASAAAYYAIVMMADLSFLNDVYAFSCDIVTAVCSSAAWFYLYKENVQTLSAGVPVSGKYIVKLNSYAGSLTGYDLIKTAGTTNPEFFQTFQPGRTAIQSDFVSRIFAGFRPFVAGATVTLEIENMTFHDINGNVIYQ